MGDREERDLGDGRMQLQCARDGGEQQYWNEHREQRRNFSGIEESVRRVGVGDGSSDGCSDDVLCDRRLEDVMSLFFLLCVFVCGPVLAVEDEAGIRL